MSKKTKRLVAAMALAATTTLGTAGVAHAAGGNGKSSCSTNGSDFSVGTAVSYLAQNVGFSGNANPRQVVPLGVYDTDGTFNLGCNPVKNLQA